MHATAKKEGYRADVSISGNVAVEQVHQWDDDGNAHLLYSCSFPATNLGKGAIKNMTLENYTSAMLETVIRQHKRGEIA